MIIIQTRKLKNRIGNRNGMLEIIDIKRENGRTWYYCKCDCGNEIRMRSDSFIHSNSCGCMRDKKVKKLNGKQLYTKHIEKNIKFGTNIASISKKEPNKINKSGHKGVYWDTNRNKWHAQIVFKGKVYFLGRYIVKEDAIKAREEAEEKLFDEFLEWYNRRK